MKYHLNYGSCGGLKALAIVLKIIADIARVDCLLPEVRGAWLGASLECEYGWVGHPLGWRIGRAEVGHDPPWVDPLDP